MVDPVTSFAYRVADGSPPGASRVGSELREARLRCGWTLPDVAARLRIRLAYLEAIEDGRFAELPDNAYAAIFVRTYAAALGLQADEVARRYRMEVREINHPTELSFPAPVPDRRVPAGAVVLLGALLAFGGYASWYQRTSDVRTLAEPVPLVPDRLALLAERPKPSAPAEAPPPVAASAPPADAPMPPPVPANSAAAAGMPPPAPPAEEGRIVLRVSADAWVQVRERGGPVLLSRLMRDGESWPVPAGPPLLLTTGNAGGVELLVDGVAVPAIGGAGAVRRDVPLDADAMKAGRPAGAASTARPLAQ